MKNTPVSPRASRRHAAVTTEGDRSTRNAGSWGLRNTDGGGTNVFPVRIQHFIGANVVEVDHAEVNILIGGAGASQPNGDGATLPFGTVIVATGGEYITTTTAQDTRPVGIVQRSTDDTLPTPALFVGFVQQVNTTGTVNIDDFLETSTSAGLARSSGNQRRVGTFGVAQSAGPNPSAIIWNPDPITSSGSGGSGGILSIAEDLLAADVPLSTTVYNDDGPSLALGAGTYLLTWRALYTVGGNTSVFVVIWDSGETTIYDEAEDTGTTNGFRYGMGGTGIAVLGAATTVKMSFSRSNDSTATMLRDGGNSTDHNMTKLVAVRLA